MAAHDRRTFLKTALFPVITGLRRLNAQTPGEIVETELDARQQWTPVAGRTAFLYSYNGQVPGPVIQARPGSRIRIRLRNHLPEETNLHYHGLHVPPTGCADNSFLHVPPGQEMLYEFDLPADHRGGTFWYHPHVHGSAARQVSRGLAGVFIIRGPLDAIPEIAAAPEFLLVLQDFNLNPNGFPAEPVMLERLNGREGDLVAAGGLWQPSIPIQRDGWIRLRILNASSSRYYRLRLEQHSFHLIASDAGPLPAPRELEEFLLVPGQRVECMIRGERAAGGYRLLSLPYDRGGMGMTPGGGISPLILATLAYSGSTPGPRSLPARLAEAETLPAPHGQRFFQLGMGAGMTFTINGRSFQASRVDTRVQLNTVEDWEISNATTMDHPMHVHTNAFQIAGPDGVPQPVWMDVVNVPANGRVRLRIRFEDFAGTTLYHCHILDHEDLGMMGVLAVDRERGPVSRPPGRNRGAGFQP
jgi:FtsP/CotA-like multicopper oxidase with cupredoxin domain